MLETIHLKIPRIDPDLRTILQWVRPADSKPESNFIGWLDLRLQEYGMNPRRDAYGNLWCRTGSETLFTAHTDTVARFVYEGEKLQPLDLDDDGFIRLRHPKPGRVLGADDGAGIAMMLALIKAGVKADFVFFRDEEIGGLGSQWAAAHLQDRLRTYRRAIALDRRGTRSVITHQGGSRCCSDAFADALSQALGYEADDGGTFTDTANLTAFIPECTNLSIGYESEHSCRETLDYNHWKKLKNLLIQVEWDKLPTVRDPSESGGFDGVFSETEDEMLNAWATEIEHSGYEAASELVYTEPETAIRLLTRLHG